MHKVEESECNAFPWLEYSAWLAMDWQIIRKTCKKSGPEIQQSCTESNWNAPESIDLQNVFFLQHVFLEKNLINLVPHKAAFYKIQKPAIQSHHIFYKDFWHPQPLTHPCAPAPAPSVSSSSGQIHMPTQGSCRSCQWWKKSGKIRVDVENHGGCAAVLPRATFCCLVTMPGSLFLNVDKDSLEKQQFLCRDANSENAQR